MLAHVGRGCLVGYGQYLKQGPVSFADGNCAIYMGGVPFGLMHGCGLSRTGCNKERPYLRARPPLGVRALLSKLRGQFHGRVKRHKLGQELWEPYLNKAHYGRAA